jgi:hypothetical protein
LGAALIVWRKRGEARTMTRQSGFLAALWVLLACVMLAACASGIGMSGGRDFHVAELAAAGGDGSKEAPFRLLSEAEAASGPGDRIFVRASPGSGLAGAIALKPNQKLIGLAASGRKPQTEEEMVRLGSLNGSPDGFIVKLARGAEVSGFYFSNISNAAILGKDSDFSGARVHHNVFSGAAPGEALIYAVDLGGTSSVTGVRVTDNTFRDGDTLGGVRVQQRGSSSGEYRFERNSFSDIGGRAYHIHSYETAKVTTVTTDILDSTADNIGVGNRNSDSILPYLMGQSQQTMRVKNFTYRNSKKTGNASNTGLEVFVYGWPRPEEDRANWCDGCRIDLTVEDSFFDKPITDGIQLTNYGANTTMTVEIRRTRVVGATPRQVGGALSLVAEKERNGGGRVTVLVEDSELSGSSAFGFANTSESPGGPVAIIDLGGGALGSKGRNIIAGNAQGAFKLQKEQVTARNNWWGGAQPQVVLNGAGGAADTSSPLKAPPRS